MTFEFDHLFICTDIGAAIADRLVEFGLVEGGSRTHTGQGTTNRCFFFHNAMLELLWVHDPAEAQSDLIRPTRLWERWQGRNPSAAGPSELRSALIAGVDRCCPFGICVRPVDRSSDANPAGSEASAFSSWAYKPPYLPESVSIAIATNSDRLTEPMLFQIPLGQRPDRAPAEKVQPLEHRTGWQEITRVEVVSPVVTKPSPELQTLLDAQLVRLRVGTEYCIELGFDGESQDQHLDFRPELPLKLCW
ncbi:MAG: VOC family protein [Leptolyngbyaceae cyanobacterium CSU_1_3]|nr:VOC family protein [Leptolyngbyaceae cyanobacterium CSU_1_3]